MEWDSLAGEGFRPVVSGERGGTDCDCDCRSGAGLGDAFALVLCSLTLARMTLAAAVVV